MRQVPEYLIIGSGRVARHFQHYLTLLNLPYTLWHRNESFADLQQKIQKASQILILIHDSAIDDFIANHLPADKIKIHFSGSLSTPHAFGAHPLMTFNTKLYSLEQYEAIAFVIDDDALAFETLLPGLPNRHVRLPKALKAKYHALCVLGANFSCMLWQKFLSDLEGEFNFPLDIMHPYIRQQTQNLIEDYQSALTGPLVRNDQITINKNLATLADDPFQKVYESFVACYQTLNAERSK